MQLDGSQRLVNHLCPGNVAVHVQGKGLEIVTIGGGTIAISGSDQFRVIAHASFQLTLPYWRLI